MTLRGDLLFLKAQYIMNRDKLDCGATYTGGTLRSRPSQLCGAFHGPQNSLTGLQRKTPWRGQAMGSPLFASQRALSAPAPTPADRPPGAQPVCRPDATALWCPGCT